MSTGVRWSPMAGSPPWAARSTRRSDRADVPVSDPILDLATADALMALALDEARAAPAHGDVPIGAVVARIADGEGPARRRSVPRPRRRAVRARLVAPRRMRARVHARAVPHVRGRVRRGARPRGGV